MTQVTPKLPGPVRVEGKFTRLVGELWEITAGARWGCVGGDSW